MDVLQTLVSVLSSSGSTVYFGEKPLDNDECIVYSLISTVPIDSHDGNLFDKYRIQLDCYSSNLAKNQLMFTKIRSLLDNNRTDFMLSYLSNRFILKDIQPDIVRSVVEFYIWM